LLHVSLIWIDLCQLLLGFLLGSPLGLKLCCTGCLQCLGHLRHRILLPGSLIPSSSVISSFWCRNSNLILLLFICFLVKLDLETVFVNLSEGLLSNDVCQVHINHCQK
jgi:hypothetical protein